MDKECKELIDKINSITKDAPINLHNELYPKTLGKAATMRIPEHRLAVIAKYEGIALVLKELGTDIKDLEILIESEADKTIKQI